MGGFPAVSVCIPTFNRAVILAAALRSVLEQSFTDIEVIISDNASEDHTEEVVRSFDDPRVRYERLPENIGLFRNMSRCLSLGTGRYRVVLPDDDLMLPLNLERKVAFMDANPAAGLVHSGFRFVADDGYPFGPTQNWARLDRPTLEPGESFVRRSIALGGLVCVSSMMLRSSLVDGERFDAADGPYADMALWLRLASRSDVGFLPEPLSGLRVHAGSASSGFQTVRARRGQHVITSHHADALLQAHGRYVQTYPMTTARRTELAAALRRCDQRLRLSIAVGERIPADMLQRVKKLVGWGRRGLVHGALAVDGAAPLPAGAVAVEMPAPAAGAPVPVEPVEPVASVEQV